MVPKRTVEHVTGDLAREAVASLFSHDGHAVEMVDQDYGEDLVVQIARDGRVEPIRLYVQVKGTRSLSRHKRGARYTVRVDREHAVRWARTIDLVVLVLWDVTRDEGLWTLPVNQVDELDPRLWIKKGFPFQLADWLTDEAVGRLAWEARFHSHALKLNTLFASANVNPKVDSSYFEKLGRQTIWQMTDLLQAVGILESDFTVTDKVRAFCESSEPLPAVPEVNEGEPLDLTKVSRMVLTIVLKTHRVSGGVPLPYIVVMRATQTLHFWLNNSLNPGDMPWDSAAGDVFTTLFRRVQ
jgi:hypothetical protein